MRVKTLNGKLNVKVIGNIASNFAREFENELKVVGNKFNNIADIYIDCSGKTHYKMYITAKNGSKEIVVFSTTNVNTIKVYMSYVKTFLANC